MKNRIVLIVISFFFIFCFIIFYKGLNNSNIYIPKINSIKTIPIFNAKDLYLEKEMNSSEIFFDNNFYVLNIWASWCIPCKKEHSILMELSKNESIKIVGLNYKDNLNNAKKFINDLGNPYHQILIDKEGTLAIEWGAYGVPETFIINKEKQIIKKFVGPLNQKLLTEIELLLK
jgi:cytochrome c biogenesis protein CcmG, thiol:disulfide interchange protein DsbE